MANGNRQRRSVLPNTAPPSYAPKNPAAARPEREHTPGRGDTTVLPRIAPARPQQPFNKRKKRPSLWDFIRVRYFTPRSRRERRRKQLITGGVVAAMFFSAGMVTTALITHNARDGGEYVYAWGQGLYGQLGDGRYKDNFDDPYARAFAPVESDPARMMVDKKIVDVAAGGGHSLALADDGTIYSWGIGTHGQLGNGQAYQVSDNNDSLPGAITAVEVTDDGALSDRTIVKIAAGGGHSLALDEDGTVFAWGSGASGQLGNGTERESTMPVTVTDDGVLDDKEVIDVSTLGDHSLALTQDGKVYSWGAGKYGQLGNDDTENADRPVAVDDSDVLADKEITAVAAGGRHSLALDTNGDIYAWGQGSFGQLGDGAKHDGEDSEASSLVPVRVEKGEDLARETVVAISAGGNHSLALTKEGNVYAWGSSMVTEDLTQEPEAGSENNRYVPKQVATTADFGDHDLERITAGWNHSLALTTEGQVYAWGVGWLGQLGSGEVYDEPSDDDAPIGTREPVLVPADDALLGSKVIAIDAGQNYSLVISDR